MTKQERKESFRQKYQEFYNLYLQGVTAQEIANQFNTNLRYILECLQKIDPEYAEKNPKKIEREKRRELVLSMAKEGKHADFIANFLGVKKNTVIHDLRILGNPASLHPERISGLFYNNTHKQCTKCFEVKEKFEFHKCTNQKDGHRSDCKKCYSKNRKKFYAENKEKLKSRIREYSREYQKERRKNPKFKLIMNLRTRMYLLIKGFNKSDNMLNLIGLSFEEFKSYIESKWLPGMSWENYGRYEIDSEMTWHIDHKIACVKFDLTKEEEQRKCFHYSNLQPLWAIDNIIKGNR